jgi:hypothetical protein
MLSLLVNLDSVIVSAVFGSVLIVLLILVVGKVFNMIGKLFSKMLAILNLGMDP